MSDTRLLQAATRELRAATKSFVGKKVAAGTKRKRGVFDGDLSSVKRLKTERDLDASGDHIHVERERVTREQGRSRRYQTRGL